jgi:putative Ca2+/H+ antiporter (TMEM165/GDT1 family)
MDLKLFLTTFVTIFLAEIGDKTQFAAIAAGSQSKNIFPTWLAVVLGLSCAGTLGVLFGGLLGQFLNPIVMKYISGSLFIIVGLWILFIK